MFDTSVPASMAALPGRTITQPMGEDMVPLPHGNKHPIKRTSEERKQQMRENYYANKARITAHRQAKYREDHPVVDQVQLHAAKICRIVHDSGPRLVILVRNKPQLHKVDSISAKRHYKHCQSIVGTYKPGCTLDRIAEDLREAMK